MVNDNANNFHQPNEFEHLYMLYFNELYRFAYHYILSDDAEDIVQEVFFKIYNNSSILSGILNRRAFMYKMVKNGCIDYLKHLDVQNQHQDQIVDSLLNSIDYDEESDNELNEKIANCLLSLPEKQRTIIELRLEGKDYNEISEILNISVGTVNTHVNRAYKFIKNNYFVIYLIIR